MSERTFKVRVASQGDGYVLSYGKGGNKLTVVLERFVWKFRGTIGSKVVTGKLRELKELFGQWAVANYGGVVRVMANKAQGATSAQVLDRNAEIQAHIDAGENVEEMTERWVRAYNQETVAMNAARHMGETPVRHVFNLNSRAAPFPNLSDCYHKGRDQFVWPHRIDRQTGEIECFKAKSKTESDASTPTATDTTSTSEPRSEGITNDLPLPVSSPSQASAGGKAA